MDIVVIGLLILVVILYWLVNLPRRYRVRQFMLPPLAWLLVMTASLLLSRISRLVMQLATWLGDLLPMLRQSHPDLVVALLLNSLILLAFIMLKLFGLLTGSLLGWVLGPRLQPLTACFYQYAEGQKSWFLRHDRVQMRDLTLSIARWATVIAVLLLIGLNRLQLLPDLYLDYAPVLALISISEAAFFLNGLTAAERTDLVSGQGDDAGQRVNYLPLHQLYRERFADRLLAENAEYTEETTSASLTDALDSFQYSDTPGIRYLGAYLQVQMKAGLTPDRHYIDSAAALINGQSILFATPFYHDLQPYVFVPLSLHLLANHRCLVILGRNGIETAISTYLQDGLAAISHVPGLWSVGQLVPASGINPQSATPPITSGSLVDRTASGTAAGTRGQLLPMDQAASPEATAEPAAGARFDPAGETMTRPYDVGILRYCDFYNQALLDDHRAFLEQVTFVLLIEPSRMLSTMQLGLQLIIDRARAGSHAVTFCAFDKNCDGLVDVLSHALRTSLTEVKATVAPLGWHSFLSWAADGDPLHHRLLPHVAHYLGVGTELALLALKNQVRRVRWISDSRFPVVDMRWIAAQYYKLFCQYTDLPLLQESFDQAIEFSAAYWHTRREKQGLIIVEDEAYNLFEVIRQFTTRSAEYGLVHVISANYLFREYMADNALLFQNDPKAIPQICADYALTMRNLALRLLMLLTQKDQPAAEINQVFLMFGQSSPADLQAAAGTVICTSLQLEPANIRISKRLVYQLNRHNLETHVLTLYHLEPDPTVAAILAGLQTAWYIPEDYAQSQHFLGARLSGQLDQIYLPGQYHTFAGKYYEICRGAPQQGLLVRRAADHLDRRRYYRQVRHYLISQWQTSQQTGDQRTLASIRVIRGTATIVCTTRGYLELADYNHIAGAKIVELNGITARQYVNKAVLRLDFPETTPEIRRTLVTLLNELFVTIFPDDYHYVVALTPAAVSGGPRSVPDTNPGPGAGEATVQMADQTPDQAPDQAANQAAQAGNMASARPGEIPLAADLAGTGTYTCEYTGLPADSILIIEDSQLDLGLLTAFERNLVRILAMISDYLDWHQDKLKRLISEGGPEPVVGSPPAWPTDSQLRQRSWLDQLAVQIKAWLGGNRKKRRHPQPGAAAPESVPGTAATAPDSGIGSATSQPDTAANQTEAINTGTHVESPGHDIEVTTGAAMPGPESVPAGTGSAAIPSTGSPPATFVMIPEEPPSAPLVPVPIQTIPYMNRHYLLFGADEQSALLDPAGTWAYLGALGLRNNPLYQARTSKRLAEQLDAAANPAGSTQFCDFCGRLLTGIEYDELSDGRVRCAACTATAVREMTQYQTIYQDVYHNLCDIFNIRLPVPIRIEFASARVIARKMGRQFIATPDFDARSAGVAIKSREGYKILIESGAPKIMIMSTMAHELTHIWQFINWDDKEINKRYGRNRRLLIYEGMSEWVEIQFMTLLSEQSFARRVKDLTLQRNDAYGFGFKLYEAQYPILDANQFNARRTPFQAPANQPLAR